jgi:hypothetical protein
MAMRILAVLALSSLAFSASPASAAMRLISTTGVINAGGKTLIPGEVVKAGVEITLSTGTAVFETGAGRLLLKGPARVTPERKSILLSLGGLLSVLPKLHKRPFAVRTSNAVAAVRGTSFFVEARSDDSTYICACMGKLQVSGTGLKKAPLESEHHTAVMIDTDGSKTSRTPAGQEHHTDAEIDELRNAIRP